MSERKVRSDKKVRVNPSLDKEYHDKLQKLALACGYMKKTNLAALLLYIALDHPEIVASLQDKYNNNESLKVYPMSRNGKSTYITAYDRND